MSKRYKILITGSSGMLGTDLAARLDAHHDVIGLDLVNRSSSIVHRFVECDITDRREVAAAVTQIKPDVVIHTAAYTDVDGAERNKKAAYAINSDGTKNVALACKKIDAPLIFISTDFVFDGKKRLPYKETDRPHPLGGYADSKLKGEEAVKAILNKFYIIRTSWLYGRCGKNFVDTIIAKAKTEKVLKVVDDQIGSPTYTKDLAKAVHRLIDKAFVNRSSLIVHRYGIYHISNSGSVSWYDYARAILKLAGSDTKVLPISEAELGRPAKRPAMSVLDNSKFTKFTGYRMRSWKAALKEYITGKVNEEIC